MECEEGGREADASDADIDAVSLDLKGGAPLRPPEAEK